LLLPWPVTADEQDWIKLDLHIHTLDDPKDKIDYSAHQLLEQARALGFGVLAITLHDTVFNRAEVFADAAQMGILLIPAAEVRLQGADVVILNVTPDEIARIHDFRDLRKLRAERGPSLFTFAPHPFYVLGASIGSRLIEEIDCFDGIEWCHFYKGWFNPNRRAAKVAAKYGKRLIATSDAHRLHAFGAHFTSIPRLKVEAASSRLAESGTRLEAASTLTPENVFAALRDGPIRLTSPPSSLGEIASAVYFVFIKHPLKRRLVSSRGPSMSPSGKAHDCARQS
jgi:predicted metal-dependent phosphoesterase TrpH